LVGNVGTIFGNKIFSQSILKQSHHKTRILTNGYHVSQTTQTNTFGRKLIKQNKNKFSFIGNNASL